MPIPKDELLQHLRIQFNLLQTACTGYDNGNKVEAINIAMRLRVLFHDSKPRSTSLLEQLGVKDKFRIDDTAFIETKGNVLPYCGLVGLLMVGDFGEFWAPLDEGDQSRYEKGKVNFEFWWQQAVVNNKAGLYLTRKQLIRNICDKEGGAHIERASVDYETLKNDPGYKYFTSRNIITGWELASTRQIGYEVERALIEFFPDIFVGVTPTKIRPYKDDEKRPAITIDRIELIEH
jgi:hypothetical protein